MEYRVRQTGPSAVISRWVRGEAFIAATGLSLAALVVGVVCACAWWATKAQHQALLQGRREQVRSLGSALAAAAESSLAQGNTGDIRSQLITAAVGSGLQACRIKLADGTVIASSIVEAMVEKSKLPEQWPEWPQGVSEPTTSEVESVFKATFPVRVAGKGVAVLEVASELPEPTFGAGNAEPGIAAAGVVGLMGLWWAYRRLRRRLRVLGAIRESLVAASAGEASSAALAVASEFGPEAQAWNALLVARDERMLSEGEAAASDRRQGESDPTGGSAHEALDCLWLGVLLLDEQMNVTYANGASAVLLRSPREELSGKPMVSLFPEDAARAAMAGISGGTVKRRVQWEVERKGENGSAVVRVSVKPARKGDHFAAMAILDDVSQQRVADKARNSLIDQASHELRTPLTNIRLYVEALLEDTGDNPAARSTAINVINQESRRLERIVADMLSVSEIEAGSFRMRRDDVPVLTILDDLKHDFGPQAQDKEITLAFDIAPKLPVMRGDNDKITLALHNLVGNALKYTPAGGTVTVKAFAEGLGSAAEILVVEVTDTGIGIKPEEHESVFERFYRSSDKRISSIVGTGLGLTLAREVARMHGGDVTLKSKVNEGSTFTFRVPAGSEAARQAA
jgi:signal transduction histidine kinase